MLEILNEASTYKKKYKCPFCEFRADRKKLVYHIDRKHENLIPEDSSALRMVFNIVNKKDHGTCIICKKESPWNEQNGRYDRICQNPACMQAYRQMIDQRMVNTHGVRKLTSIPEHQEKMLAGRKISGTYKWSDGTEKGYTGSFEKNALEFLDNILECHSWDVQTPGPVINYEYNGEMHFYISDIYYIPYNLIIEIKDGGDNPNMREMRTYREKQLAKERQIIKDKKYNYLRLTNNNFSQLLEIFAELKMAMQDASDEKIIRIHEHMAAFSNGMLPVEKKRHLYLAPYMMNNVFAGACLSLGPTCDQLITVNTDSHFLEQQQAPFLADKQYKLFEIDDVCKEDIIKEVYKAYTKQREVENDYLMKVVADHTHKGLFLKETLTSEDRYNFFMESTIANILQNPIFFESAANLNNDSTEYSIQEDYNGYFALYKDGTRTASVESVDLLKEYLNENRYYNSDTIISEEDIMNENKIFNQKDLYYNKEKFNNGEINLCFITGFSGSGKSTMGRSMSNDKVEHYELDDVINNKMKFTMENFKEYGDLIYSFFNGVGKKYYYTAEDVKVGTAKSLGDSYDKDIINDFVDYSIKYAKSHKDTKFVIEGVWIYAFISPTKIADYAVCIKGTSAVVSSYRAVKRDIKNDEASGDHISLLNRLKMAKLHLTTETLNNHDKLKKFRDFFYKRIPVSTDTPKDTNKIPVNESKSNHFKSIEDILKYISSNYRNMKYNEIQNTVDKLSDHLDSYGPSINATLYLAVPIKNDKEDRSNTCPFFIYSKDDDEYWFDLKHNRSSNKSFKGQTDAFEDYAKTIFKSRSVVVGYSIDDYSDKDAYEFESSSLNEITETKNRFDLDDEEEKYIQSIRDFCNELKKYKYGIIIDGKIKQNPSEKDFWDNYKTLTISEFEKYKCGTCYDYVAYQMDYFKKHFPEAKCKAYYLTYINEHGDFSHTFMTFEYHGYWFWFEATWKSQAGVDQIAKNEKEILDNICLNHQYEHEKYLVNKKSEKILKQYNPLSMQGLTLEEFSKRVNPNCEKLWTKYGLNESAILNENFLDAINMSKDQKEFLSQFTTILSITDWVRSKIRYAESNQLRDYNEIMMERCANDVSISHFIKTLVSKSSATVDTSKVVTVFGSKQDEKFVSRMDDKLTHTVYVYSKNEKYYWFESKIYDKRGVHGPFISYSKLKEELGQMVMDEYNCKTVSILTNASSISTNKDLTKDEYLYAEFESGLKHAAIDESATSKSQLYFVSTENLDKKILAPRIPSNYFTRNNFEENTTPRVCLSTSIEGACIGLSQAIEGTKLYVHTPVNDINYYTPTTEEVPDRKFSHEVWVKEPVRMKCIGQIKITEATKSHKFTYGKTHEGELWEWSYEWIKRNT